MKKYSYLVCATLIAIALLPASALAQEQDTIQPIRAQIGVQAAATSLFDIIDAADNPRLMLDDMGTLTVFGMIHSTTDGFVFPDNTVQMTAATSGLWTASGSDILYSAGDIGIGAVNSNVKLNVRNDESNDFAFNVEQADGTNLFTVKKDGDMGVGAVNGGVKLNVKNINDRPFVFNLEQANGDNLFTIDDEGAVTATGPLAVSGLIESTTSGFKFPDGTTQTTAATSGLWSASGSNILYSAGEVGVGAINTGVKLNVKNINDRPFVFNLEQANGDNLFRVKNDGTIDIAGNVGIGTTTPTTRLDVAASGSAPSIVTRGGKDYATVNGQIIDFGHWDGTTFTERMAINPDGAVGVGAINTGVKLNVQNVESNTFAFNVEQADGDNLFRVRDEGTIDIAGNVGIGTTTPTARLDVAASGSEPSIVTRGGKDYATVSGQDIDFGHWDGTTFTERMAITPDGAVGVGAINTRVKLNVKNIGDKTFAFNVEKSDGTNLFTIQNNGVITMPNGTALSKEGDLNFASGVPTIVIDHPLDPAEKQLRFTAVEAPDRYTFHTGTVVLNGSGAATVTLPDWYEASNTDLRYQLTPIGAPGPNLYIAREVQNNRFEIAGGTAGMKVSWQLTATRSDAAARARPFEAEAQKTGADRGRYYTPEAHGQPVSLRITFGDDADTIAQPFDN